MSNTTRNEKIFDDLITKEIENKKALDIGCGVGVSSQKLISSGASYVYGVDISEKLISEAKRKGNKGKFDIITGRAFD